MTTTASDPEVATAEAEAETAEALANSLEDAIRSGDTTITPDELTKQRSLVGFLRLQVDGARTKAEKRRVEARAEVIANLKAEVLKRAPESGAELVKSLKVVEDAARAFYALSSAHDAMLAEWVERLQALQISEGQREQGIGLNGIGYILVDGAELPKVDGGRYLNKLFVGQADPYGRIQPAETDYYLLTAMYDTLKSIGKAN